MSDDGLVDLKRTKAEQKESSPMQVGAGKGDDYPYGLGITLDHDSLKKLGVNKLPKAGDKIHLHAHAHVRSVEERHEDGGKKRREMRLELRKMRLEHSDDGTQEENAKAGAKAAMDKALSSEDDGDED
jgi:hypothetical protein